MQCELKKHNFSFIGKKNYLIQRLESIIKMKRDLGIKDCKVVLNRIDVHKNKTTAKIADKIQPIDENCCRLTRSKTHQQKYMDHFTVSINYYFIIHFEVFHKMLYD